MKFLPNVSLFFLILLEFSSQSYCSEEKIEQQAKTLDDFKNAIRNSFSNNHGFAADIQKKNLDSLIQIISPAFRELDIEDQKTLVNRNNQLGAYFAAVVENAISFYSAANGDFNTFANSSVFVDPFQFKEKEYFKTREDGESVDLDIDNPEDSDLIFNNFFKIFFQLQYPKRNTVDYQVLKYFLANLAAFAFSDKKILKDTIDLVQKKVHKSYNLEPLIDGAVRVYAYRVKQRQGKLRKMWKIKRALIWMKDLMITPVSEDTIVYLMKQWNKINSRACEQYITNELAKSLTKYGFLDEALAEKTKENIRTKSVAGTWERHKYKIIASGAVAGGIAVLAKDQETREKIQRGFASIYNRLPTLFPRGAKEVSHDQGWREIKIRN